MTDVQRPDRFIIVGENIHTTRSVQRKGARVKLLENGTEAVRYRGEDGQHRNLTVPDWYRETQAYQQGQVKHFMIAVRKGLSDDTTEQEEGADYVRAEVRRQIAAGAHFLDLNVDEVSHHLDMQKAAMRWLVEVAQAATTVPLSIDSSNAEIIEEGLKRYDRKAGRPLVNSAALERLETLDTAREHDAEVIVTAAGVGGMPSDEAERLDNITQLIDHATARGIAMRDVHVDALVFPISVDQGYGRHYLAAVKAVRERWGPEIHITGGLSNVSFGLPNRKLINEVFIELAIEHGLDGAIMDPVQSKLENILGLDHAGEPYQIARAMLLGEDEYCVNYLQAWRAGKLG